MEQTTLATPNGSARDSRAMDADGLPGLAPPPSQHPVDETSPGGLGRASESPPEHRRAKTRWKHWVSLAVVIAVAAAGVGVYRYVVGHGAAPLYRTARVERGALTATVSATGNLNAVIMVLVGSQVSGTIKELDADFNTAVRTGQIIARIDPALFEAAVNQARADLESSRSTVLNQEAQVEQARTSVENALAGYAEAQAQTAKALVAVVDTQRTLGRQSELFQRELVAAADRDTAQTAYNSAVAQHTSAQAHERALAAAIRTAEAQLRVQEAALTTTRDQVQQKQAALAQTQINLDHTTIRSPVDGVVVNRAVDVGQTVAAALQAPTLFTIAQDLTKMQVEASVDEADIGRINADTPVTFTVDAFPGETFTGIVAQIRKAPQVVQNVVTYTVVVAVANPAGKLLPGMTANVKFVTARRVNVLKVSNMALRFRPLGAAEGAPAAAAPQDRSPSQKRPGAGEPTVGRVWVLARDGQPRAVAVTLGVTDGTSTEITRGDLDAGREVLIGIESGPASSSDRPPLRF
jgi:HlyD family secretion protein